MRDTKDSLDIYCGELSRRNLPGTLKTSVTDRYFRRYEELSQEISGDSLTKSERRRKEKEIAEIIEYVTSSCLPYVIKLSQDFCKGSKDKELLTELIASGNEGLCKAFYKYNYKIGTPFHYYASAWIKAGIRSTLKQNHRLVKNSPVSGSSVYMGQKNSVSIYETPDPIATEEVSPSHAPSHEYDTSYEMTERLEQAKDVVREEPPLQQMIFNYHSGNVTESTERYTCISRMLGVGVTTAFVKHRFHNLLPKLSDVLASTSTRKESGIS